MPQPPDSAGVELAGPRMVTGRDTSVYPIRTAEDHRAALSHIEERWRADPGIKAGDELDVLVELVEHCEDRHFPFSEADPVEILRSHREATGRSQNDLARKLPLHLDTGIADKVGDIILLPCKGHRYR